MTSFFNRNFFAKYLAPILVLVPIFLAISHNSSSSRATSSPRKTGILPSDVHGGRREEGTPSSDSQMPRAALDNGGGEINKTALPQKGEETTNTYFTRGDKPTFSQVPRNDVVERDATRESLFDPFFVIPAYASLPFSPINDAIKSLQSFSDLYQSPIRATRARNDAVNELPTAELGVRYCYTLDIISPNNLLSIRLSAGALPKGLGLLSSNRQVCGVASASGIYRFSLAAFYGSGDFRIHQFRLVVGEHVEGENTSSLTITTLELPVGALGSSYSFQLAALGGTKPYVWDIGGLPEGLELDSASGVIGGTPKTSGEFGISVTLKDSSGARQTAQFNLILRTSPVFITTQKLEPGVVGEFYQSVLDAQGGKLPYRWELLNADLPNGLEFDTQGGVVRGEPQATSSNKLFFQVADAEGKTDTVQLALEIRASSLRLTSTALPDGFVGEPYAASLEASGGVPPYRWTGEGGFPRGLILTTDGTISGTPSNSNDSGILIKVHDSNNVTDSKTLFLRIGFEETPSPTPAPVLTPTPTPFSPSPIATPTPAGTEENLAPVTRALGTASDGKVGFVWSNPQEPRFLKTRIVRHDTHFPETTEDGVVVYDDEGTTFLDTNLTNGRTYYYSFFAEYSPNGVAFVGTGSQLAVTPHDVSPFHKPDVFVDEVLSFSPLDPSGCYNCKLASTVVLGQPRGAGENNGSADVVSFNAKTNSDQGISPPYGGSMTLRFTDNIVVNGPGPDFIIFENAFRLQGTDLYWVEPAVVEVSADGVKYYRFPFDFVPHFDNQGNLNLQNPFSYAQGFAGVKPVYSNNNTPDPTNAALAGGDAFDLSDLPGVPLQWIQYIRITSTGDLWMRDIDGELVRHMNGAPTFAASGKGNSGFDLDAISAVHY